LSLAEADALQHKILVHWDEIQAIAAQVPPASVVADLLRRVGGPTTAVELGFDENERALAVANGHYLRNRFTVRKLMKVLGL